MTVLHKKLIIGNLAGSLRLRCLGGPLPGGLDAVLTRR
jgi:hypothetical protein